MILRSTHQTAAKVSAQWLAVPVYAGQTAAPEALRDTPSADVIVRMLERKDIDGSTGETTCVFGATGLAAESLILYGVGSRDKREPGSAFSAGVALGKKLAGKPKKSVALALPSPIDSSEFISALIEGVVVGTRGTDLRKSEPTRHAFEELLLIVSEKENKIGAEVEAIARRAQIIGDAVNLARDLANTPPAEKTPTALAGRFRELGETSGLIVEVWDEKRLREERFGGLLAVAAGSDEPPAFVRIELADADASKPTLALVGKGVTFDSGGLSLKPSASMEDMKSDMTGAAVVFATLRALAQLKIPLNRRIVGYAPLTENMTGGRAMKLGDVLTMRNGKTVEVMNTDAEGRLILADALSFAAESKPSRILDLATLTGACLVALGPKVAGLFSNDDSFANDVFTAATRVGERAWRLPMDADYFDQLKSGVADFKNVGGKYAGAITAAKFLEQFVAEIPWVHLDIAGPSWADSDSPARDAGGTGCFVRTLIELIAPADSPSRF